MPFKLSSAKKSSAEVTVGETSILFSYDACVAYTGPSGNRLVNPDYVGFSPTTTAAINAAGYKQAEVAESRADFETRLSISLRAGL